MYSPILYTSHTYGYSFLFYFVSAAYTEKYQRNQETIDDEIKLRYSADVKDARENVPMMTARIRGEDEPWLDKRIDNLVWGGKLINDRNIKKMLVSPSITLKSMAL